LWIGEVFVGEVKFELGNYGQLSINHSFSFGLWWYSYQALMDFSTQKFIIIDRISSGRASTLYFIQPNIGAGDSFQSTSARHWPTTHRSAIGFNSK